MPSAEIGTAQSFSQMLDTSKTYPQLADQLFAAGAGQCWSSPQEMDEIIELPHGTVETFSHGDDRHGYSFFQRIWNAERALFLNTYA